jgi:hypothetical protein
MPSPFPGMNPYLENPELWLDVHHELISQIRTALSPALRPRYMARVELRVYIADEDETNQSFRIPDVRIERTAKRKSAKKTSQLETVAIAEPLTIPILLDEEIKEARVEIRQSQSNALVAVIEVLSPANKVRGSRGRESFMEKRQEILASEVHWIEIDLLRAGEPSMARLKQPACDYRIVVSRGEDRRHGQFWPVSVRQALPVIGVPLRGKDADVPLDLGAILQAGYDNAGYDLSIDYRREPEPPLSRADIAWAAKLLRQQG